VLASETHGSNELRGFDLPQSVGSLSHLSPLDLLSILFHETRTRQQGPPTGKDRIVGTVPWVSVVLFSGDSMNREMFMRLIHHVRYGHKAPNRYHTRVPFHELSQQHDMIYLVKPGGDALLFFHSPLSDGQSLDTVAEFFQSAKRAKRSRQRHVLQDALVTLVFMWDPLHAEQRHDAFVADMFLSKTVARHNLSIQLATNTDRILLGGRTAKSARAKMRGIRFVVNPVNSADVCQVTVTDTVTQVVHLVEYAEGNSSSCTPRKAAYADAVRKRITREEHQRHAARPTRPLREIAVGIAVHVSGHVFWDRAFDAEGLQRLLAVAAADVNDLPLTEYPLRALPIDSTKLFLMVQ